jgi:hypothetical protein
MWKENPGVTVKLEAVGIRKGVVKEERDLIRSGKYQIFERGEKEVHPAKRSLIYLEIERILSEEELPIIPIFHCNVDDNNGWARVL